MAYYFYKTRVQLEQKVHDLEGELKALQIKSTRQLIRKASTGEIERIEHDLRAVERKLVYFSNALDKRLPDL